MDCIIRIWWWRRKSEFSWKYEIVRMISIWIDSNKNPQTSAYLNSSNQSLMSMCMYANPLAFLNHVNISSYKSQNSLTVPIIHQFWIARMFISFSLIPTRYALKRPLNKHIFPNKSDIFGQTYSHSHSFSFASIL